MSFEKQMKCSVILGEAAKQVLETLAMEEGQWYEIRFYAKVKADGVIVAGAGVSLAGFREEK